MITKQHLHITLSVIENIDLQSIRCRNNRRRTMFVSVCLFVIL